jgi:phosphoglucomutase
MEKSIQSIIKSWINNKLLSKSDLLSIKKMNENYRLEAFYRHVDFGTGGIRAKMALGSNFLNPYSISRITTGIADYLLFNHKTKIALGYDTRNNSSLFASIVTNILLSKGIKVYTFESFIPTPLLSFSVQHLKLDLGIMITASHNPPEYNGYKIYDANGCQLVPHQAKEIKKFVDLLPDFIPPVQENQLPQYIDYVKIDYLMMVESLSCKYFSMPRKLKVAYTSLHGTGYEFAKKIIQKYHEFIEVPFECTADGNFSNVKSSNPEDEKSFIGLQKLFVKEPFDIGLATDPDADRLGALVNHRGNLVLLTGNQVGALLTNYLIKHRNQKNSYICSTIVSSDLAKEIARKNNIEVIETLTGFKYIGEQIDNNKNKFFLFGYEESFGFLLNSKVRDKDAFQPIPILLDYVVKLKTEGKTLIDELESLYKNYGYYHEELITFTFEGIEGSNQINKTIQKFSLINLGFFHGLNISEIENYQTLKKTTSNSIETLSLEQSNVIKFRFKEGGWVVFRPSGTEPKLKIYLSLKGGNKEEITLRFKQFKESLLASL